MRDGHIHTPYCPHGTKDSFAEYVERAIILGYEEITFTEHAPLPEGFIDTTPSQDSAMKMEELESYFEEIQQVKSVYKNKIKINAGLEVDYIEGYETTIKNFLNKIGHQLDDAVLSVHFLKYRNQYDCLDYSPDDFYAMIEKYGSIEKVYENYYRTLRLSLDSELGPYKPKRIGHITLVHKFQRKFPTSKSYSDEILSVLNGIKTKGYEMDYNGAGTAKPLCREPYPPNWVVEEAVKMDIPIVYGSDAHQAKELGQGRDQMIYLNKLQLYGLINLNEKQ